MKNQLIFTAHSGGFVIASSGRAAPILIRSNEPEALHVAVNTFAEDVERVTGVKPEIHLDSLPNDFQGAIVVSIAKTSKKGDEASTKGGTQKVFLAESGLAGQWESFQISVKAGEGDNSVLAVTGSDRVSHSLA
jgi:hypothetical protein